MSNEKNNLEDDAGGDELESNELAQTEPSELELETALNSQESPLPPIQYETPLPLRPLKDKEKEEDVART